MNASTKSTVVYVFTLLVTFYAFTAIAIARRALSNQVADKYFWISVMTNNEVHISIG